MENEGSVRAVERTLTVIEYLREQSPATLSEITGHVELPKSTVHRHLKTLKGWEYVVERDGEYLLSLRFLGLGERAREQHPEYRLAAKKANEIAEHTAERVQFITEEHGRAVFVHQQMGSNAVRTDTFPGKRVPIHASAAGLAILSQYPQRRVDEIVEQRGLDAITSKTISSPEALDTQLERTRERGYSINDQGIIEGLRAIGAPVIGPSGTVIGGLSISGPINRMEGERFNKELPALLLGATNELELNIKYQ